MCLMLNYMWEFVIEIIASYYHINIQRLPEFLNPKYTTYLVCLTAQFDHSGPS